MERARLHARTPAHKRDSRSIFAVEKKPLCRRMASMSAPRARACGPVRPNGWDAAEACANQTNRRLRLTEPVPNLCLPLRLSRLARRADGPAVVRGFYQQLPKRIAASCDTRGRGRSFQAAPGVDHESCCVSRSQPGRRRRRARPEDRTPHRRPHQDHQHQHLRVRPAHVRGPDRFRAGPRLWPRKPWRGDGSRPRSRASQARRLGLHALQYQLRPLQRTASVV